MNRKAYEVNFDGLVGPTHNYSGLSYGNIASMQNQERESNPMEAALQGLEKMRFLMQMGLKQGILPPHERPHIPTLIRLGFYGTDAEVLEAAYKKEPHLLQACSSSAAMWAANAATVTPSSDSTDDYVHFTPANLIFNLHRSIEPDFTGTILQKIFDDPNYFKHHRSLPAVGEFTDEGAANHTRLCQSYGSKGIHLFVFGRYANQALQSAPIHFPGRQTFEASRAIARLHNISNECVLFCQQHPKAIDAGVFHNDVAAVGNCNLFLYHESAFVDTPSLIMDLKKKIAEHCRIDLLPIAVSEERVPLKEAVNSYLFNSQIVSSGSSQMVMIAPTECQQVSCVKSLLDDIAANPENPITEIHYMNLRESMRNGGGPACLRLRVVLTESECEAAHPEFFLTEALYNALKTWICKHYRDKLHPKDLADPLLLLEIRTALDELTKILNVGSIYSFQR
jgi:succinylarginine dihydrolase